MVARLEPKLPIFRFLLLAYEQFPGQREQVLLVLRLLLETPALAAWPHAVEADHELREALGAFGLGLSPVSRSSHSGPSEYSAESQPSEDPKERATAQLCCCAVPLQQEPRSCSQSHARHTGTLCFLVPCFPYLVSAHSTGHCRGDGQVDVARCWPWLWRAYRGWGPKKRHAERRRGAVAASQDGLAAWRSNCHL